MCRRWSASRESKSWSGSRTWHPWKPMIGPDTKSYIFCQKIEFGPEKIGPPRIFSQNLVRVRDRTSPPIIGGPVSMRRPFSKVTVDLRYLHTYPVPKHRTYVTGGPCPTTPDAHTRVLATLEKAEPRSHSAHRSLPSLHFLPLPTTPPSQNNACLLRLLRCPPLCRVCLRRHHHRPSLECHLGC